MLLSNLLLEECKVGTAVAFAVAVAVAVELIKHPKVAVWFMHAAVAVAYKPHPTVAAVLL